jgi:hypothetical protein
MKQKPSSRRRHNSIKSILRLPDLEHTYSGMRDRLPIQAAKNRRARHASLRLRSSPLLETSSLRPVGRGLALIQRGNTLVAAVAEVNVDRSNGAVTVKRRRRCAWWTGCILLLDMMTII